MIFSVDQYNQAVADYNRKWLATDVVLYDLCCRRHPDHCDPGGVRAKLWIIGRTYATGIERHIDGTGSQGGSLGRLATHMLNNARKITDIFRCLSDVVEPLTPATLQKIVDLHGRLGKIVSQVTRNGQSSRSFCSKYMHFHCPAVPIYDSYAAVALHKLVRWRDSFQLFAPAVDADEAYVDYVLRFWQLHQQAVAARVQPTVKHLDKYLLYVAGSEAKA